MTKQETLDILAILQAAYPDTCKGMSDEAYQVFVKTWQKSFADDDFGVVYTAIFRFISTHTDRFAPNIGQIKQEIYEITTADGMTGTQAWALVTNAVRNSAYNSQEEFAKLPEIVRKTIGSASVLREYAALDVETFQSVTQSNFLRAYRTMEERASQEAKTPYAVREYIAAALKPMPESVPELAPPKPDAQAHAREAKEQIAAVLPPKKPEEHGEITPEAKKAAIAKAMAYLERERSNSL